MLVLAVERKFVLSHPGCFRHHGPVLLCYLEPRLPCSSLNFTSSSYIASQLSATQTKSSQADLSCFEASYREISDRNPRTKRSDRDLCIPSIGTFVVAVFLVVHSTVHPTPVSSLIRCNLREILSFSSLHLKSIESVGTFRRQFGLLVPAIFVFDAHPS
jgi:hypothetical protein